MYFMPFYYIYNILRVEFFRHFYYDLLEMEAGVNDYSPNAHAAFQKK